VEVKKEGYVKNEGNVCLEGRKCWKEGNAGRKGILEGRGHFMKGNFAVGRGVTFCSCTVAGSLTAWGL
jgi:hypothetical protein